MTQRKGGKPAEIQNTEETTMKTLKIYNPLIAQIASESNCFTAPAEEYAAELFEALENDDTDLADYADDYHGATYYKKLHKVTMSAEWYGKRLYGLATCEVDDDWTDEDTAQLKEYLSGQYSDGWARALNREKFTATRRPRPVRNTMRKQTNSTKVNGMYATMFTFPSGRTKTSG